MMTSIKKIDYLKFVMYLSNCFMWSANTRIPAFMREIISSQTSFESYEMRQLFWKIYKSLQ